MIIKNNLRPTAIRTNSRFRGPTELGKYTNFVLETVHDLKLLGSVMDRNDFVEGHRGHTDFIRDNFAAYVSGDAPITSSISTASTLYHPIGDVFEEEVNLMDSSWATYGECMKMQTPDGVVLESTGLLDPVGVAAQKYVEEGDIIYIRMGVRLLYGDNASFTLGSHDINQNEGDITKYEIPQNGSIIYVDKRLYCKHREPISINIDVHNLPETLEPTSIEVRDVEIKYLSENNVTVEPVDIVVKSRINNLESKIRNIINNI
jgi:hypothetical protein